MAGPHSATVCCVDLDVNAALLQVREALEAAAQAVPHDPEAATDDILAARLIIDTLLLVMTGHDD